MQCVIGINTRKCRINSQFAWCCELRSFKLIIWEASLDTIYTRHGRSNARVLLYSLWGEGSPNLRQALGKKTWPYSSQTPWHIASPRPAPLLKFTHNKHNDTRSLTTANHYHTSSLHPRTSTQYFIIARHQYTTLNYSQAPTRFTSAQPGTNTKSFITVRHQYKILQYSQAPKHNITILPGTITQYLTTTGLKHTILNYSKTLTLNTSIQPNTSTQCFTRARLQ